MDREGKTARNYIYFEGTVTAVGASVKSFARSINRHYYYHTVLLVEPAMLFSTCRLLINGQIDVRRS